MTAFSSRQNTGQEYPAYLLSVTDANNFSWSLVVSAAQAQGLPDSAALETVLVNAVSSMGLQYQPSLTKLTETQTALYLTPTIIDDAAGVSSGAPNTQWLRNTLSSGPWELAVVNAPATFHVALLSAPTADVTVTVAVAGDSSTGGTLTLDSASSLTFTSVNWNTPQDVTVTGRGVGANTQFGTVTLSADGYLSDVIQLACLA